MSTWYRQGTISVTNGIATVTGIGTAWGAANTHPGDVLLAPDGKLYEILSVDSVTQLTIKPTFSNQIGYQGTTDTAGNAKYAIAPLVGSTTTADLAQRISAILTAWQDRQDELSDWQGGTVTGGDGNGYYPLTDSLGAVTHVMCPAKITYIVGNLDAELTTAQGYATSAQSSATSAQTYASQAGTSATNAGNSATAANTSATNANNSATSASTSAATATTKASEASSSATSAAASASTTTTKASEAAASATAAGNSATAAAASAASINPSSIVITGGTINNTPIGATTPSTGAFTTLKATGGVQLATSTGNLLVGTTTDDGVNKLQVNGSIRSSGTIRGATLLVTNTNGITLSDNAVGGFLSYGFNSGRTNAAYHIWYNGISSELMRLNSSGNLLIGTTTDNNSAKLQIDIPNYGRHILLGASAQTSRRYSIGIPDSASLEIYDHTDNASRLRVTGSGNLLVGTTTDDGINKLQVNGSISTTSYFLSTATTGLWVRNSAGGKLLLEDTDTADGGRPFGYIQHDTGNLIFGNANRSGGATTNSIERLRVTASGNIHTPAGSTDMTNGFIYIPSASGIPSGTPTAISGTVPMYVDAANNRFYVYVNSTWKYATLT